METLRNQGNAGFVLQVIDAIHEQASYLSEIDGATGDGDHGINMNKGFMMAKERIEPSDSFAEALKILGRTLVMDIGGSMGPIYGTMFSKLSRVLKKAEPITKEAFLEALENAVQGLMDLAGAKVGDKTLVDTIYPACQAYQAAIKQDAEFSQCLREMAKGAEAGKESTKDLVAKIGRAARLGERSRGHLDAGATSCWIILTTMANAMLAQLQSQE